MSPELSNNMQESITELANLLLITFLLFIGVFASYAIWHMRMQKMREYKRRKYDTEGEMGEKLHLTTVLPDLSRDEMKKVALEEKERVKDDEEVFDLDAYDGLPLKPTVYFDPKKDAEGGDDEAAGGKIVRSFLSNEPLPKHDEHIEKPSVEEAYKANEVDWKPIEKVEKESSTRDRGESDGNGD